MLRNFLLSCFFMFSFSANAIKVVHFNIQEFDTVKIQDQGKSLTQAESVKYILNALEPDILSLNEIQYDLPEVPNKNYLSTGQNLEFISRDLLNSTLTHFIFFPSNAGKNALRNEQNEYVRNPDATTAYRLADPVNFGMFPAQYSIGGLTRYPVLSITEINSLQWKEFNPNIDLSRYADERQQPLPEDMLLFDKNFTDATLLVDSRPVHLILLHTVPAFAFNNTASSNFARNRDQLLFLKWYLGGAGELVSSDIKITPLKKGESFIAMGDWNADINKPLESAQILKKLGEEYHYANDLVAPTFRGMELLNDKLQLHLDYILLSNDIGVKTSGIFAPVPNVKKLGCQDETEAKEGFILVDIDEHGQTCRYLVEKNYYYSKMASDHLAVWADIYFR